MDDIRESMFPTLSVITGNVRRDSSVQQIASDPVCCQERYFVQLTFHFDFNPIGAITTKDERMSKSHSGFHRNPSE